MSRNPRRYVTIDGHYQMIEWESDLASDQQRSVVATFHSLLDQLERDFPQSYDILRFLSFLDPEYIPLAILTDGAQESLPRLDQPLPGNSKPESSMFARMTKWTQSRWPFNLRSQDGSSGSFNPTHPSPELRSLVSLILSPTAFPKALHKLQSLSLVEPLLRDGQSSLRMHDLVHFLTQEHVKRRPMYEEWLKSAVSLVCDALSRVENPRLPKWWFQCENLMPHVRSLSKVWAGVEGVNLELAKADVGFALYLNGRGRYGDAERTCERSVGIFRKELGDRHELTLSAFHILASVYDNQGRFAHAEEAHKHILAVAKMDLGANHAKTLMTMNNLALVYHHQGRYKEAEELYKQVLVKEKKLGLYHPITLMTMHNLASVYDRQSRYNEAEKLLELVLVRREKDLGLDDVDTLTSANNLASVYQSQSKYVNAEELFKRVLVSLENQLGPSHPLALTTAVNLAILYESQARNDEAERFYLRAFTGRKQQLCSNHPDTSTCAGTFASFYRSQGRNNEADTLLDSMHE
jgi:tetratricopeptide (TPR) repeat protein